MQARSSVFKELLSNGTDRLRITDFQPKVIQKMIEFCNNDSIENFEYEETSLFAIGYDYKIKSLMAYTSGHIASTANIDNAVARFKFAHFYGYESLKKWFFNFIITNFVDVSKTPAFKTLDTDLYKPFLEELLKENKIQ
uniref:BTB domain-containing protein n=1 Tax=Panagrolaimus sp. ES5 TaxID=591445 RepID=A0AC34FI06_9BILA